MEKKKVIKIFGFICAAILVFLPGYSKYQELAEKKRLLEEKRKQLEMSNKRFSHELMRLEKDSTYVEKVARDKLKVSKKGEVIYKVVEDAPQDKQKR